jgi:copper(I)-binding protein
MLKLSRSAAIAVVALAAFTSRTSAQDITAGDLRISQVWSRATPSGAKVAGGFMRITNVGKTADRLIGGTFPLAARFEVHEMAMDAGVMRMRELTAGLEIKPGETVDLKPGGYHVMFMELTQPLEAGKPIKGTLRFERTGTVEVTYTIAPIGAAQPTGVDAGGVHGHHK